MEADLRVYTAGFRTVDVWRFESLAAPYWRIYWNDREGWEVRLGSRTVGLGPDRLVVIPPETPCSAHSRCPAGHFHIHFVAAAPFDTVGPSLLVKPLEGDLESVVSELVQLATPGEPRSPRSILLSQQLCIGALLLVPEEQWSGRSLDPRVAQAVRTMGSTLGGRLSNPMLAREAGMHTNAFIRLFRGEVGRSPQAWYMRRRIEEACRLLHHSELSIEQVAERTGFCDRGHFTRAFRKLRRIGPGEFRKRNAAVGLGPAASVPTRST